MEHRTHAMDCIAGWTRRMMSCHPHAPKDGAHGTRVKGEAYVFAFALSASKRTLSIHRVLHWGHQVHFRERQGSMHHQKTSGMVGPPPVASYRFGRGLFYGAKEGMVMSMLDSEREKGDLATSVGFAWFNTPGASYSSSSSSPFFSSSCAT